MRITEWLTDEPCVFDSGHLGYLTAYQIEAHVLLGDVVELIDLDGQVAHRWPPHPGRAGVWIGRHLDRRTRLDARLAPRTEERQSLPL